jgi:mRNA-degrading endonuclease RelE of RelBE toxin-antitoxin system
VRIEYAGLGLRDLDKLDARVCKRIAASVERLPHGDIRRIVGADEPTWRLRVGGWRVMFVRIEPGVIVVTRVLHSSRAY